MAFTYNTADLAADSAAGRRARVRLYIADCVNTTDQPNIFDDAEIDAFLAAASNDCFEAGAFAFETWARSRSRIALKMERDGLKTERQAIDTLLAAAQKLRAQGFRNGVQTGSIVSADQAYLDEFRPAWRGLDDIPVVE